MAISANVKKRRHRLNREITAPTVRLVDPDGVIKDSDGNPDAKRTGVMGRDDALRLAQALELDLVEVGAGEGRGDTPIVRIMNYSKFLYEEKKNRKKTKTQKIKEVKLRPVTDKGDYEVKLRNLISFLEAGDKVKVTIRYRGREITHQELGAALADRIIKDLDGHGVVDARPKLEGRQLVMVVSPDKRGQKAKSNKDAQH